MFVSGDVSQARHSKLRRSSLVIRVRHRMRTLHVRGSRDVIRRPEALETSQVSAKDPYR